MDLRKSRMIIYFIAILVFMILTLEEMNPFFGASEVFDFYDIIGNGLGSTCAILTLELFVGKKIKNQ